MRGTDRTTGQGLPCSEASCVSRVLRGFLLLTMVALCALGNAYADLRPMQKIDKNCFTATGAALPLFQNTRDLQLPTRSRYQLLTPPAQQSDDVRTRGNLGAEDYSEQISVLTQSRNPRLRSTRYRIAGNLSNYGELFQLEVRASPIAFLSEQSDNGQLEVIAKSREGATLDEFRFDLHQIVYLNNPSDPYNNQRLAKVEWKRCDQNPLFVTRVGQDFYRFEKSLMPFRFTLDIDSRTRYVEFRYAQRLLGRHWLSE